MPYKCTVVESSMELDFDLIIPDKDKRPGVAESWAESQPEANSGPQEPHEQERTGGDA